MAARVTISGTHRGEFMGVPATGRSVSFRGAESYRVRDGRLAEEWAVTDLLGLLTQLGALPAS